MSGLKRTDSELRAATPVVDWDEARGLVKINPIANWTHDDVSHYEADRKLPIHPLFRKGYLSIGCSPTTRPVSMLEDRRAGGGPAPRSPSAACTSDHVVAGVGEWVGGGLRSDPTETHSATTPCVKVRGPGCRSTAPPRERPWPQAPAPRPRSHHWAASSSSHAAPSPGSTVTQSHRGAALLLVEDLEAGPTGLLGAVHAGVRVA